MRRIVTLFFITLFIVSCSGRKIPKGILPPEKMQAVLWDMIYAGEYQNAYVLVKDSMDKVSANLETYGRVFQVNHITREDFEKSYSWYRQHPKIMNTMLDSLSKQQTRIDQMPVPVPQAADTVHPLQKAKDTLLRKKPAILEVTK